MRILVFDLINVRILVFDLINVRILVFDLIYIRHEVFLMPLFRRQNLIITRPVWHVIKCHLPMKQKA